MLFCNWVSQKLGTLAPGARFMDATSNDCQAYRVEAVSTDGLYYCSAPDGDDILFSRDLEVYPLVSMNRLRSSRRRAMNANGARAQWSARAVCGRKRNAAKRRERPRRSRAKARRIFAKSCTNCN